MHNARGNRTSKLILVKKLFMLLCLRATQEKNSVQTKDSNLFHQNGGVLMFVIYVTKLFVIYCWARETVTVNV